MGHSQEHLDTVVLNVLGPEPSSKGIKGWLALLDYRLTARVVRHIAGGSPRFVLFRCEGCRKIWTARKIGKQICPCGARKFSVPTSVPLWKTLLLIGIGR